MKRIKQPWELMADHIFNKGIKRSWLKSKTGISHTHMHFVFKGERPLSEEVRKKINKALETQY